MIKINNYKLPTNKKIFYSLLSITGIGKSISFKICDELNLNPNLKWDEIEIQQKHAIINLVEKKLKFELKDKTKQKKQIDFLKENGSIRGFRLRRNLPVRGQRTHSNARTQND